MKYFKYLYILIICILITPTFLGCNKKPEIVEITIAEQYGFAYAPIQIMKEKKMLENKMDDNTTVNWVQLANTTAIREAMLTGDVDFGFMAIPPFLIGWEKGMEWKIATGLSCSPIGLVTYDSSIQSIKDFSSHHRIALPQPGSVQHILLSMAAEKIFSDSNKFDRQLVTMSHPDGMNALIAKKDISAHFTSPPYLNRELSIEGMHQILTGEEAMGKEFSFIIGVATEDLYNKNQEIYQSFLSALEEAIQYIQKNPKEASIILSKLYNISENETLEYMQGIEYTTTVKGLLDFSDFMTRNNYLQNSFSSVDEVLFEGVSYEE